MRDVLESETLPGVKHCPPPQKIHKISPLKILGFSESVKADEDKKMRERQYVISMS